MNDFFAGLVLGMVILLVAMLVIHNHGKHECNSEFLCVRERRGEYICNIKEIKRDSFNLIRITLNNGKVLKVNKRDFMIDNDYYY